MADIGRLVVNLEANIARFTSEMGRATQQTEQAMSKINSIAGVAQVALGAVGIALSVDALVGAANRSIEALAELDDMAQKTGASVENLSKLGQVAAMTGTEFGTVDAALVKLAKNMTTADEKGSKFAKAMNALGISTKDIAQQDPAEVFVQIANKLQNYQDGAGKAAVMTDAISKSAADLLPYMNDVSENFDKFTGASAEAAAAASRYQDDLGRVRVKYDEMVTTIVSAALPATNDFVGALGDVIKGADGVEGVDVAGWADDVAVGMARVVDVAILIPKLFSAVSGSFKVVAADLKFMAVAAENANPVRAAIKIAQGENPIANIERAAAERNKVLADANANYDKLWNQPANQMEQAVLARIAGRKTPDAGPATVEAPTPTLTYVGGGGTTEKSDEEKAVEEATKLIAKLREQSEAYGITGAALLEYQLNHSKTPPKLAAEAVALQQTIDKMKEADAAQKELAEAQKKAQEEAARAELQNKANVDHIGIGLMTDVAREENAHQLRLAELQKFHDARLENVTQANALIEAENQRHAQVQADMQLSSAQNLLNIAQSSAGQLYDALQAAGMEQTALGKAMFWAQKAIQVATIIVNTEVAAAAAQAGMIAAAGATAAVSGPAGPAILAAGIAAGAAYASVTRVMGYATAGLVAGTAIASAEGGYDIPRGVNPVTQLHEEEMVLPKAQANVIRGLATNGGGAGGAMKLTIVNNTRAPIGKVTEQRISATERALIIEEAVSVTASTLADPNSKTSRAMSRNFNVPRSR